MRKINRLLVMLALWQLLNAARRQSNHLSGGRKLYVCLLLNPGLAVLHNIASVWVQERRFPICFRSETAKTYRA